MDNTDSICKAGISLSVELNKFLKIIGGAEDFSRIQDPNPGYSLDKQDSWHVSKYKPFSALGNPSI